MGLLKKSEVERLKREKRERKAAKKRKENVRKENVHFLIVCEGEQTEPNYFKSLISDSKYSEVLDVNVEGEGMSTCTLVRKTEQIKNELERKRQVPFDIVWVVFDKDDFDDFNEAIALAESKGYIAGWSNESFELWYLLHFQYLDAAISRHDYIKKIEEQIRSFKGYENFVYNKGDRNTYCTITTLGSQEIAIKNAKRLDAIWGMDKNYQNHKPCTMIYKLIEQLENPEEIIKKYVRR